MAENWLTRAKTFRVQQILYVVLFTILVRLITPTFPFLALAAFVLLVFIQARRLELFALLNLVLGLAGLSFAMMQAPSAHFAFSHFARAGRFEYALAYLAALVFCYGFVVLTTALSRLWALTWFFACCLCATFFLSKLGFFTDLVFLFLIQGAFWNAFLIRAWKSKTRMGVLEFLACQSPFFMMMYVLPVPALLSNHLREPIAPQAYLFNQRRSIKLLFLILILKTGVSLLYSLANQSPMAMELLKAIGDPVNDKTELLTVWSAAHGIAFHWAVAMGNFLRLLLGTIIYLGMPVAFFRIMGIDLLAPVYDIFGAKTFYQFFERTSHYYCRVLIDIFVFPIHRQLSAVKNQAARFGAALFIGIVVCGLLFHFFYKSYTRGPQISATDLEWFFTVSIYWVLIGAATCLSFVFERTQRARLETKRPWLPQVTRWAFYFVISSMMFIFISDYTLNTLTLHERLSFFLSLFGIS